MVELHFNTISFLFLLVQCSSSPVNGEFLPKYPPPGKFRQGSVCQFLSQFLIFVSLFILGIRICHVCLGAKVCESSTDDCGSISLGVILVSWVKKIPLNPFFAQKALGLLVGREGSGCTCSNSEGKVPSQGFVSVQDKERQGQALGRQPRTLALVLSLSWLQVGLKQLHSRPSLILIYT